MQRFGKLFQILGLAIPPFSIMAQLADSITQGQMLMFLVAAACAFWIGRILEGYAGQ